MIGNKTRPFFRDIKFWLIGFSYLFIAFSILIPFAFITTYATEELQIPYESATGLVAVIAIAGVFGKLVLGYLSDLAGRIQVMMICGAFTAAGGMGMVYAHGFWGLAISMAVFGIGYGAIWPVYAASTRDFFPKEYAGSVIGLWTVLMGIGSILAPLISGWIIDITGSHIGAFILVVISALLSLSLLFPITIARKRVPLRSQ